MKKLVLVSLVALALSFTAIVVHATAGNISLVDDVATIQCTTDQYTANKPVVNGTLYNAGANTVYINTIAGTVVTTSTQAQNIIGIPAATFIHLPTKCQAFTYKTGTSTTILYWLPD